jgi:hypothetical protein
MTKNILCIGLLVIFLVGCARLAALGGGTDQNKGGTPPVQKKEIKVTFPI